MFVGIGSADLFLRAGIFLSILPLLYIFSSIFSYVFPVYLLFLIRLILCLPHLSPIPLPC